MMISGVVIGVQPAPLVGAAPGQWQQQKQQGGKNDLHERSASVIPSARSRNVQTPRPPAPLLPENRPSPPLFDARLTRADPTTTTRPKSAMSILSTAQEW